MYLRLVLFVWGECSLKLNHKDISCVYITCMRHHVMNLCYSQIYYFVERCKLIINARFQCFTFQVSVYRKKC